MEQALAYMDATVQRADPHDDRLTAWFQHTVQIDATPPAPTTAWDSNRADLRQRVENAGVTRSDPGTRLTGPKEALEIRTDNVLP